MTPELKLQTANLDEVAQYDDTSSEKCRYSNVVFIPMCGAMIKLTLTKFKRERERERERGSFDNKLNRNLLVK